MTEKREKQYDDEGFVIRINKEEEKRKRDEIRDFAKDGLLSLKSDKYHSLPIDETLRKALIEGKRLTGNAYQRHLSFIVRLIHEQGFDAIKETFERVHHPYRNDPSKIKEIELYRDKLIAGDKSVLNDLMGKFADVDIQYLRQLARNAKKEYTAEVAKLRELEEKNGKPFVEPTKPTKSAKAIYQYIFKLELL